LFLAVLLL